MAFTFKGEKRLEFDPDTDLTLSRLRAVKGWYPELGSYRKFMDAVADGDPNAIASLIWIARQRSGERNPPPPPAMEDFAIGADFYDGWEVLQEELQSEADEAAEDGGALSDPLGGNA